MRLLLINSLGTVADTFSSEYKEDIVEWAKEVYMESYTFQYIDANFHAWVINCMDIYPQDITCETFRHLH